MLPIQQERLQKQLQELKNHYDLLSEKISRLRKSYIIETDVATKFKLEHAIAEAETERKVLEEQLEEIASHLSSDEFRVPEGTERFIPRIKPFNLMAIQEILQKDFNLIELEKLSWNIGLDISTMRTESIDSFAIDIVKNADQLGKRRDLVDAIERIKPSKKFVEQIFASEISTTVRSFLSNVGFEIRTVSNTGDFIAEPLIRPWNRRFFRGLYIIVQLNEPLDQDKVYDIYQRAKEHTDHSLVVINQQPTLDAWMAIAGLRAQKNHPFVFLPITDSIINESLVSSNESDVFDTYIEKYLGQGYDPYDVVDPVSDALNFFGRAGIIDETLSKLRSGKRVGLFGLQKMGKSSILQTLQKKADFPVAYVYLSGSDSIKDIYSSVLESWKDDIRLKFQNVKWNEFDISRSPNPKSAFESATKNLLDILENVIQVPHLSIFFDEIDAIVPYQEGNETKLNRYLNLMDSLRRVQQETNSLSLLVAGVYPKLARVNFFWGNQKNPMHQVISEKFLPPLDQEDCKIMIQTLGQQIGITYEQGTINTIIQKSGAHPFLARRICSLAYKKQGNTGTMPHQKIQEAMEEFILNPSYVSYFDEYGLWGELGRQHFWGKEVSKANHEILCRLADSENALSESELCTGRNRIASRQAFYALRERSIISPLSENSNLYQITFGVFRDWICLSILNKD